MGQSMPRIDAIRQISATEQTYYRWKKKYGGMGTEQLKKLKRLQKEKGAHSARIIRPDVGQAHSFGSRTGKLLSPSRRRAGIDRVRSQMKVSERRVCHLLAASVIIRSLA